MSYRSSCSEMASSELDWVILSAIACARGFRTTRTRKKTNYIHQGKHICLKLFLHLHGISRSRMTTLLHHYDTCSCAISPRIHGNTKRRPKHGASFEDTTRAVTFIKNFAAIHAMPLPGRQRGNRDEKYLLLPSDKCKAFSRNTLKPLLLTRVNRLKGERLRHSGMKLSPILLPLNLQQTFVSPVNRTIV